MYLLLFKTGIIPKLSIPKLAFAKIKSILAIRAKLFLIDQHIHIMKKKVFAKFFQSQYLLQFYMINFIV